MTGLWAQARRAVLGVVVLTGAAAASADKKAPAKQPADGGAAAQVRLRALVVTGGHGYHKPTFNAMCRSLEGIRCRTVVQPKAGDEFAPDHRDGFDVVVLYDMVQYISERHRRDFVDMLRRGKGLVVLHHALAARQGWDEYGKIVGGRYYTKAGARAAGKKLTKVSTYRHDVHMNVKVADKAHPITADVPDYQIFDEVYKLYDVDESVHVLLTTDHPENAPTLAWTNTYGRSRVVYLQLGHGWGAYNDSNYRELLARSIRWAAPSPDDRLATPGFKPEAGKPTPQALAPDEAKGWVQLFNGKDLDGWEIMGDKAGWEILNGGVIRSDGAKGGNWLRYAKQEFGDFILRVEWRVSKDGNSGVFVRAKREGQPWVTGHEIQISNAPRDDAHCTGSLYGSVAVKPRPDESPGRWHAFEIRCEGEHFVVLSDGVKIIDATYAKHEALRSRPLRGCIGLQDAHAGPGKWIEWRNIRLKPLGK